MMSKTLIIWGAIFILLAVALGGYVYYQTNLISYNHYKDMKPTDLSTYAKATFSGGCFWCSESDFEKTDGVVEVVSGFAGGKESNPDYKEVASGSTSHREAIQVYYDPEVVSYDKLLDVFWRHVDPTDDGGQFVDRGFQYSTAIFYHNEEQKAQAEASKKELAESGKFEKPIVTPIVAYTTFYPAEDYHQDYHKKNPIRYSYYRGGSGRDRFIEDTWGNELKEAQDHVKYSSDFKKPSQAELQKKLTPLQYKVTQKDGTETPFENKYWDNKEEGIYVDIVSGEPLYSSTHKYKSGTGWPSFTQPIKADAVVEKTDFKLFVPRTEIRSKIADSHLGHVFDDGPKESGGKRYCMNSAALRFVPKADMEAEGYGEFLSLFE